VADGGFQVAHLVGRVPLLIAVVLLGEVEVRDQHFGHSQSFGIDLRRGRRGGEFEFEARFGGQRLGRPERAGKELLVADSECIGPGEPTATGLLMEDVGGGGITLACHGCGTSDWIPWNDSTESVVRKPHPAHAGVSRNCFG
jgi:hypothetical protein